MDGGERAACPLARLRNAGQEGTHYHHNSGAKWSVYVSEYITEDYPLPTWEYALQRVAAGVFYNRYYLMELGDNSWLCVYFDDYLTPVSVDAETYYSMEMWYSALVAVAPAVMLGRYQVLCGVPGEEWAVHVTVKDADSGEVISEHDFPTRGE